MMSQEVVVTTDDQATQVSLSPDGAPAKPANVSTVSTSPAKAQRQTGPRTDEGKRKSAKNALRDGLYAPGVVHEAEAERLKTLRESLYVLTQVSDVDDHPMLAIVIESIAMLHIRMARVLGVETQAMTFWYADLKVKGAFCKAAGLSYHDDVLVPDWYFGAVDVSEKREAQAAPRVLKQAKMLFNYAQPPQGLEHAANLADLRAFAQEQLCDKGETMVQAITRHFDGVNFAARMRAMVNWFEREYAWELRWAANAARYEAIVARLRADAFGEILANDARQKLYASFSKQLLQQMTLFEQMRARAFLPQVLSA
jgi:hypothetical protein